MIPIGSDISNIELSEVTEPSKTYYLDFEAGRVVSIIDGIESVKQAILKYLITNRFEHDIYNPNYASELQRLAGKDEILVKSEVKRLVEEALSTDDRIILVDSFIFETNRDSLLVKFKVTTVFGNFMTEVSVNV